MQRLRRFARYWDMVGNSGNFIETTPLIWRSGVSAERRKLQAIEECGFLPKAATSAPQSPFHSFLHFSDWLYARTHRTDGIALSRLMELLFEFLTTELHLDSKAGGRNSVARLPARRTPRQTRLPESIPVRKKKSSRCARPKPPCPNARRGIYSEVNWKR